MSLLYIYFNELVMGSPPITLIISILYFLFIIFFTFFRKPKRAQENSSDDHINDEDSKPSEKKELKKIEVKTIVIEEQEQINVKENLSSEKKKRESITISIKLNEQIERITLKILYEEKSAKTLKILNDKVLERAARQKITVSEKIINIIIRDMHKIGKIEFTQKEGWKIKI